MVTVKRDNTKIRRMYFLIETGMTKKENAPGKRKGGGMCMHNLFFSHLQTMLNVK